MTSRDFAYWLQGFFEVADTKTIDEKQTQMIKNHLNLVFYHEIDKQYKPGDKSQEVHDGKIKLEPSVLDEFFKPKYPWNGNLPGENLLRC